VRKFNFFNYTRELPEVIKMAQNPDVTVRSRGVMEKCTFCIQRITRAKRKAKRENRPVADGEFQTACQQSCPTGAIYFGNIIDSDSRVAALKKNDRNYELLAEFNIRPRNSYLAIVRNPNPLLVGGKKEKERS
jgi:molybdopterin-containing oxidoreductase family iron-sulfur binding subunit